MIPILYSNRVEIFVCHAAVILSFFQNILGSQDIPSRQVQVSSSLLILSYSSSKVLTVSRDSVHIIPWLASPLDETSVLSPRLRQRTDAGPIELFYDVFLVANLATFLATHEIIDIKGW